MAYIICEPCVGTKDTACVDVCPVDCIHPRKDEPQFQSTEMLYIHPDECIDCALCEPECPVKAIFSEDELPEDQQEFLDLNRELAERWPNITEKKDALPDYEKWDGVKDKIKLLER